jgi:hypothetical protein
MKAITQIIGLIELTLSLPGCTSTSQQDSEIPWSHSNDWVNFVDSESSYSPTVSDLWQSSIQRQSTQHRSDIPRNRPDIYEDNIQISNIDVQLQALRSSRRPIEYSMDQADYLKVHPIH